MKDSELWITMGELPPIVSAPGVEVWTLSSDTLMLALVRLAPGAVVAPHSHENEQTGSVVTGTLTFTIDDDTRSVSQGQGYLIPPGTVHAGIAGPEGALVVEVFSPPREAYRMNR